MDTERAIRRGMARAFFASAYADQADGAGQSLRGEIMDQLPSELDVSAIDAANRLWAGIAANEGRPVLEVYDAASGGLEPREWGHYAAMQAMGHGVGLWDYDVKVRTPHIEFSGLDLSTDYF